MGVGMYPAIEPLLSGDYPQGRHRPLPPEEGDVPVYRSQGKIGNRGLKLMVDPLSSGMGIGGSEDP
jgi:hypothetical protein